MASIPLFEGRAGSLPNITPEDFSNVPELIIRARESGQNLAEGQERIENLRQNREINALRLEQEQFDLRQRKELAPLELEAKRLKLETDIANAPERAAAEEAQLAAQQDEFARAVKLRQKSDLLMGVIQSGNPQAIKQAAMSGEFADVFAADPKFQNAVIQVAGQFMSAEEIKKFQAFSDKNDMADFWRRRAALANEKFEEAQSTFEESNLLDDLKTNVYGTELSDQQIAEDIEFLPSNGYKVNAATQLPENEPGRLPESIPIEEAVRSYDAFSKKSGERLRRGIDPEEVKNWRNYRRRRNQMEQYSVPTPLISNRSSSINQAAKTKEQQAAQGAPQAQGPVPGPAPAPTAAPTPAPPPAPVANTPDTNQAPVAGARQALTPKIAANPALQDLSTKASEARRKQAEALAVGKKDASFEATIFDTAQMFTNISSRPTDVQDKVITRVNSEPLLANKSPLIKAIAAVESGGKRDAVSPTGVRGLMQVTRPTAGQYGLDRNIPEQNVEAGERELYRNLKLTKSPELALAAYNAGIGTILEAIKVTNSYDWEVIKDYLKDNLPPKKFKEVKDYPEKVLNYAAAFGLSGVTPAVEV